MQVKLDDIEAFVAVADLGGFKRAADDLCITQSALSRRLKKLEDALGARLLDRTTRKVSVSAVGEEFLPEARRMLGDFRKSLNDVHELVRLRRGVVSVATNMTIADTVLPRIVARFVGDNPDVRVRVTESSSPQAIDRVLRRESELAIAQVGDGHPELEFLPLIVDHFVLVCHKEHPLAQREVVEWRDVAPFNFIQMRAESGTMRLLGRALGEMRRHLHGDVEVGHFNALLGFVGQNIGVSAIPTLVNLKRPDLDLVTRPLRAPSVSRSIGIVTQRGRSLSPSGAAFLALSREMLSAFALQHAHAPAQAELGAP